MYHNRMNNIYYVIGLILILIILLSCDKNQSKEGFVRNQCDSCIKTQNHRLPDSDVCPYFKIRDWDKYKYFNKYRIGDVLLVC